MPSPNLLRTTLLVTALGPTSGCLLWAWDNDETADGSNNRDTGEFINDTSCFPASDFDCLEPPDAIATFDDIAQEDVRFATTATAIYFADPEQGRILEVAIPSGAWRTVVQAPLPEPYENWSIAADDLRLYYLTSEQVLVDDVFVEQRQVRSFLLPYGPEVVVADAYDFAGPYLHDGELFYRDSFEHWVRRPADGTGTPAPFLENANTFAFDVDTVYFYDTNTGALAKAPLQGPIDVTTLTQSLSPERLQLDGTFAYVCSSDGVLYRADTNEIALAEEVEIDESDSRGCAYDLIGDGELVRMRYDEWDRGLVAYDLTSGALDRHLVMFKDWGVPLYRDALSLYFLGAHTDENLQDTQAQVFRLDL